MASKRQNVKRVILDLVDDGAEVTNRQVAELTGLTRQAVHYHLRQLVAAGELDVVGAGRSTRYQPGGGLRLAYPLAGLEEHVVWHELLAAVAGLATVRGEVHEIARYSFTEMLNNAIDHSGSELATVSATLHQGDAAFQVTDDGIGAFDHVRQKLGLATLVASIEELSKGKATTMPQAHSGEGIFFTSKAVDYFELESNGLKWIVDNARDDQAIGESNREVGTKVAWNISLDSELDLSALFEQYTIDFEFARSLIVVKLFERGDRFVSRSEAKRVAAGLERFREVVIDFRDIKQVGQGFADELFRVWANDHPETRLVPTNMVSPVETMVRRALP